MLLPTFPSFRSMGVGVRELGLGGGGGQVGCRTCLRSNAYYPRTPDYTLYAGVHVCWSEHSDSSCVYGFISLDDCLGTMPTTI